MNKKFKMVLDKQEALEEIMTLHRGFSEEITSRELQDVHHSSTEWYVQIERLIITQEMKKMRWKMEN
jgi:hypothetical protein